MRARAPEPCELEDDRGLSLRELMESLEPGERPSDPDATRYFPIDERETRTAAAPPAREDAFQHDATLHDLCALQEPKNDDTRGLSVHTHTRAAPAPLIRKLLLLVFVSLVGLLALGRGRRESVALPGARAANPAADATPSSAGARAAPLSSNASPPEPAKSSPVKPFASRSFELERGASLEQAAVERVESGDFDAALPLYRELAATYAERPVFAEAVRILERRASQQARGTRSQDESPGR